MKWQQAATTKKRKIDSTAETLNIDKIVRERREELEREEEMLPSVLADAEKLSLLATQCEGKRHLHRRRLDLLEEVRRLRERAERIRSKASLREFEEECSPFLSMYHRITHREERRRANSVDEVVNPRAEVVHEFLSSVMRQKPRISIERKDSCPRCGEAMRLMQAKSVITCVSCGYCSTYLDSTTSSLSYGDDVEFSTFSYKRINHFQEWLSQIQGKENFLVPQEDVDRVMEELYRQRVSRLEEITAKKVREVLKTLKMRKCYEHAAQIAERVTGIPAPKLSTETEEMCKLMFKATQPIFKKHCPPDRKNFLSYSYCCYKYLQLLGEDHFLKHFTLLKGRDKLQRQDQIFEKICAELNWQSIPT